MNIGIDLISFHTPAYALPLTVLAERRGVDPAKFSVGIGQDVMAIPPPDQDIVSLAANAALPLLEKTDRSRIRLLLFSTESGIDQSKAASLFCRDLLSLPNACRCSEIKEACYGGTAALRLAAAAVAANPSSTALVLAADVARYDLASPGEPTQGAGAVAMLVSANPRILSLDPDPLCGVHSEDIMDFWRPNYRGEACVDGKYSTKMYLTTLVAAYRAYKAASGRAFADHDRFLFHLPFTKIALKAHSRLLREENLPEPPPEQTRALFENSTAYNRLTGNTYSACVWESLVSLLDNDPEDLSGKRLAIFSYGSGCVAEFFSGLVVPGYRDRLFSPLHRALLANRTALSYRQYEDIFNYGIPKDGADHVFAPYAGGPIRLAALRDHKRRYEFRS